MRQEKYTEMTAIKIKAGKQTMTDQKYLLTMMHLS